MFGWSVKSVPGCLVLIAPSTIGDPVAFTPGFEPHDDVPVLADAPLLLLLPVEDEPLELALVLVLDELLLPHAASATSAASETTTATAIRSRARGTSRSVLTSPPRVLTFCELFRRAYMFSKLHAIQCTIILEALTKREGA
jgi:hypothetical protein